jgi:hypothetical protein
MVLLFDQFNLPEDIFKIIFATEQQEVVARLLTKYMFENNGEIGKTEMSIFANLLHEGSIVIKEKGKSPLQQEVRISYNKRQFYDRILTPMKSMGLIDYDMYKRKYKLSDRFNKLMIKLGLLWLRELDRGKLEATLARGQELKLSSQISSKAGKIDLKKLDEDMPD